MFLSEVRVFLFMPDMQKRAQDLLCGEAGLVPTVRDNSSVRVRPRAAINQVGPLLLALSNNLMVSSLKRTQKV
jgi:hypothetical protein